MHLKSVGAAQTVDRGQTAISGQTTSPEIGAASKRRPQNHSPYYAHPVQLSRSEIALGRPNPPTILVGHRQAPVSGAARPDSKSKASAPKIAYVRRRSVYVAPYAGRFAKYSRGILYEG